MDNINQYTGLPTPLKRDYTQIGSVDIVNVLMAILAVSGGGGVGFQTTDSVNLLNTSTNLGYILTQIVNVNSGLGALFNNQTREYSHTSLPSDSTQTLQITGAPSGTLSGFVQGGNSEGRGRKGRLSKVNFMITQLGGGVRPTISFLGSPDNNTFTKIGVLDSQTLQNVPAATPLDPTNVNQSFRADNDFYYYKVQVNNNSGNTACIVVVSFS